MTISTVPIAFAHVDEDGNTLAVFGSAAEAADALRLLGPLSGVEVDAVFGEAT